MVRVRPVVVVILVTTKIDIPNKKELKYSSQVLLIQIEF